MMLNVRWRDDADYLKKLTKEERQWYKKFTNCYYWGEDNGATDVVDARYRRNKQIRDLYSNIASAGTCNGGSTVGVITKSNFEQHRSVSGIYYDPADYKGDLITEDSLINYLDEKERMKLYSQQEVENIARLREGKRISKKYVKSRLRKNTLK